MPVADSEELPEHGRGRPPHRVPVQLEERDRSIAALEGPQLLPEHIVTQELGQRNPQDRLDLPGIGAQLAGLVDDGHEGVDQRRAADRHEPVELTDAAGVGGVETDLLPSLPDRSVPG